MQQVSTPTGSFDKIEFIGKDGKSLGKMGEWAQNSIWISSPKFPKSAYSADLMAP